MNKLLIIIILTFSSFIYCMDQEQKNLALLDAVKKEQFPQVLSLLFQGANPDIKGAIFPLLHIAATRGNVPILNQLLHHNSSIINIKDVYGNNALFSAINKDPEKQYNVIATLISYGININQANRYHKTPLEHICATNDFPCVELLINAGAIVNEGCLRIAEKLPHENGKNISDLCLEKFRQQLQEEEYRYNACIIMIAFAFFAHDPNLFVISFLFI